MSHLPREAGPGERPPRRNRCQPSRLSGMLLGSMYVHAMVRLECASLSSIVDCARNRSCWGLRGTARLPPKTRNEQKKNPCPCPHLSGPRTRQQAGKKERKQPSFLSIAPSHIIVVPYRTALNSEWRWTLRDSHLIKPGRDCNQCDNHFVFSRPGWPRHRTR